jgi:hypothetical protein
VILKNTDMLKNMRLGLAYMDFNPV